jgi:hypothetical protein
MGSNKHEMYISEVNKISLNPFDDKRYICDNGIKTYPYAEESTYCLFDILDKII